MTAGVLEHPHRAVAPAHRHQRQAEEIDRHGIAGLGDVLGKTDPRPVGEQHPFPLDREDRFIGVMGIRQAMCGGHRLQNGAQILVNGHFGHP